MKTKKRMIAAVIALGIVAAGFYGMSGVRKKSPELSGVRKNIAAQQMEGETEEEQMFRETSGGTAESETILPESFQIEGFPILNQMPELPTGCEITAMTMVLNYFGYPADKVRMAVEYLPTLPSADVYIGDDGKPYGNDMNRYFIGDPQTSDGIICGPEAIVTAANTYLGEESSSLNARNLTGAEPEELYRLVSENIPVVVWCTIGMEDRQTVQGGWYTEGGEYVDWSRNDHGAVLVGYGPDTVMVADPISGFTEYDRTQFESVFASRGNQCVILSDEVS